MHRTPAFGLLMLLAGQTLSAQVPGPTGTILRLGGGITKMDFTCGACEIDAKTGVAGFLAASRSIGSGLTVGLEMTFADANFDTSNLDRPDVKLFGPMATAGLRVGSRVPVWGTIGLGWLWYSGIGPNSNGPAGAVRAGADLGIGSLGFLSPYAGYVTMLGHDGPEVLTGDLPGGSIERTRLGSFQLGVAVTLRP